MLGIGDDYNREPPHRRPFLDHPHLLLQLNYTLSMKRESVDDPMSTSASSSAKAPISQGPSQEVLKLSLRK